MTNAAFQVWECDVCHGTYKSPVALHFPPTHHCPSPKARLVRSYKLRQATIEQPNSQKERTSS